jgi:ABC-2 type transport system ATP-binding protein
MPLELALAGLSKTYPNGVQALSDVTLTIPTGMYGLLGPNGAGKSTLMRTLATLQEADAGTARLTTPTLAADAASLPPKGEQFTPWDGPAARMGTIDVLRDKDAVRARLGYLPQDFGVYPKVSAQDLLDHLARLKGIVRTAERRDVVTTLLRQVNLYEVRKKALGGFSGGMRQRFGIAQALIGNPELVIVDEPTAGLDPEERVRFHNLLAEIGENVIVILSTHIVSDVSDLCANMAIIDRGEVLLTGAPQTLTDTLAGRVWQKAVAREDLEAAKAAFPVIATRLAAGRTLVTAVAHDAPGPGFAPIEPTLDDVYFAAIARRLREPAPQPIAA